MVGQNSPVKSENQCLITVILCVIQNNDRASWSAMLFQLGIDNMSDKMVVDHS